MAAAAASAAGSRLPCRTDVAAGCAFVIHLVLLYPPMALAPPPPPGQSPSSPLLDAAVAAASAAGLAWAAALWSIAQASRPSMPLSSPLLLSALVSSGLMAVLALVTALRSSLVVGLLLAAVVVGDAAWVRRARGRMTAAVETLALVGRLIHDPTATGDLEPHGAPPAPAATGSSVLVRLSTPHVRLACAVAPSSACWRLSCHSGG
jgi:hypothetical protein